jgi:hypothetical protein
MTLQDAVYAAITDERHLQAIKWAGPHAHGIGDCSSPDVPLMVKVAVLTEEVGEVARAALDHGYSEALRVELVQVAAVAVAILEGMGVMDIPEALPTVVGVILDFLATLDEEAHRGVEG